MPAEALSQYAAAEFWEFPEAGLGVVSRCYRDLNIRTWATRGSLALVRIPSAAVCKSAAGIGKLKAAVVEREVRVETADGSMRVFVVRPDGDGPFPVAVVYMDGVGYRDQIKENARRFAGSGYYCVAPDLFYRAGDDLSFDFSKIASEGMGGEEGKRLMAAASSVTPERAMADTRSIVDDVAFDPAAARGAKVCVGYCMGARIALRAASMFADEFVAAAGIHPGALVNDTPESPHHDLAMVRGELYYAFAEIDRSVTPELVDRFRAELERNNIRGVVERIPGVAHGFAMADLPVYNHDAAEHHFERTLDLWRRNLS